jgi:DNA-binding GntR family transcriptional regulator
MKYNIKYRLVASARRVNLFPTVIEETANFPIASRAQSASVPCLAFPPKQHQNSIEYSPPLSRAPFRGHNKETSMNKGIPPNMVSTPLVRGALRHEVAKRLLASIYRGQLPANTRLVVQKLAEQFGISATPVREALLELEVVGIVGSCHNRGAVVKPFGPEQLRDIYHVRRILEGEAARCACGRIDATLLTQLKQDMLQLIRGNSELGWSSAVMESDLRFHTLIASHCGNPRLRNEIERYSALVEVVRETVGNERDVQIQGLSEHLAVIAELLANKPDSAALQMARHIDSTAKSVSDIMFPGQQHSG